MGAASKQGAHHMAKELAVWYHIIYSLFVFALDADASDGTNIKASEAVNHSL